MKQHLLIAPGNFNTKFQQKPIRFLFALLLVFVFGVTTKTEAQCIGPYQTYESFKATTPSGWTYTGSSLFTNASNASARSGGYLLQHSTTNNDATVVTPLVSNPKTVSFYVRKSANTGIVMSYNFQFTTDGGTTWYTIPGGTNTVNGANITATIPSLPTVAGLSAWDLVTATFNTNVASCKFRIADSRTAGVSGALQIDDFSWDCYTSAGAVSTGFPENTVVVPAQIGLGVPTNCTGGTITVDTSVSSSAFYNFYDDGGESDSYNLNQSNQVTFKPTGTGYAAGDRIRIQFISYTGAATTDKIDVWDDNGTTLNGTTLLLSNTATTMPAITTYISTISSDGSITVKFTSDGATNAAGFNIKVDCVRCPVPTGLASSSVGATTATVSWSATTAGNYDVYYNTTGVLPLGAVPQFLNIASTSQGLSSLITSQIYYVWVRSRCGSAPDSYSPWSPSINFTTVDCSTFVIGTQPSTATQTRCLNTASTALTVSATGQTVSTYQWYSNTTATTSGGTTVGTNSASYTPLTTSAGTLYYYCIMTSTLGCTVTSAVSGAVTINPLPTATAGNNGPVCSGTTLSLSGAASGGSGSGYSYSWNGPSSYSNGTQNPTVSASATVGMAGVYTLTVTDSNTCSKTSTTTVTVYSAFTSGTISSTGETICNGGTPATTIGSTTAASGGDTIITYSWRSSADGYVAAIAGATSATYLPPSGLTTTTSYQRYAKDGTCNTTPTVSSGTWTVTVRSAFTTGTIASTGETICSGGTPAATIGSTTAASGGDNTITYSWRSSADSYTAAISGATSATYLPPAGLTTTTSYIRYANDGTCTTTPTVSTGTWTVTITNVPSAPVPTAGTGATTSSITANWNAASGSPAPTGYFLDVATDSGFTSMVSGYNNLSVGNVLTYTVTGLAPGTTYYYRVRAINSCGTGANFGVTTYATLSLSYCTPPAPATSTSYINNFSTSGGITNISNLGTGFTVGGYANYTSQSCSQYPSSSIGYSITSVRSDSTDQTFFYYIWVDWTNDGDFVDAGETMLATTTYQGGPFTGSFAVPAAQASGSYRMRVSTSWVGANTSCTFSTSGRGEFEDYTLTVVPVPPCATSTPSALTSSSISGTSATISWTDAAATPNSVYEYFVSTSTTAPSNASGTVVGTLVTGVTSANLTGLTLANTYYFWVRSHCSTSTYGTWVGYASFTTVNFDIINMTNGSSSTCNGRFYDSGGSAGNYVNNETYTYTIYPNSAGSKLKVVFNSFSTENNYDGMLIYNGNSTSAPLLSSGLGAGFNTATAPAGSYRGTGSPGTVYSTAADGSLTFVFRSDGSVISSGWDATVSCVTVPVVSSFTPTSACSGTTPVVTITGSNFVAGGGATSVLFNGVSAAFTIVSDTSITATLPASATTGYISVTNAQASGSSTTFFSVNPTPSAPNAGSSVAICAGASTTLNGTSTGVINTVLSETFNAGPWPSGWSRTINGTYNPGDFRTSSEFVSGGNTWAGNGYTGFCSYFYSYLISGGTTGDMISPTMDLSTYTSSNMTFWIYNSNGTDALRVYANNNGGSYALVGTYTANYGSWTQITVNLNAYVGAGFNTVRIKFTGTSDGGSSNIGVDDIAVTGTITATYLWSPSAGLSPTNILNPVATPSSTTNYTLTTSFPSGCSASSTPITITVNPKPTVTITTPPANVCGNSVQTVNVTGTATTYTWTSVPANTLYSDATGTTAYIAGTNTTTVYVKTPTTATITVTGTNAATCSDTASVVFTVTTKTYTTGLWNPAGTPPATGGTDNLVFNTAWTFGSLSGCSCTVNGGASVFSSGQTLTLTNGLTVSGGSLTFNNGASLIQSNNVANTGNITYIRDTTPLLKYDYTYWSSPVSPQTIVGFTPLSPLAYIYNAAGPNWAWVSTSTTMTAAKGYIVRAPSNYTVTGPPAPFTASFVGVPNNGTYTTPITAVNFNLIGNPYPSALSADIFLNAANNPDVDGTIYLWTHNTPINVAYQYTGSDYALYNFSGGVGTGTAMTSTYPGIGVGVIPNGYIAAGQGFMIKGLSNGVANFTNAMRSAGTTNSQFFRNATHSQTDADLEKNRVWLDITNSEGAYKQVLVGYIQNATNGLDRGFDGEMVDIGNVITFYTMVQDKKLSIQGKALPFDVTDTVPLGYKSTINGTYTIALSDFDGLFTSQNVYLEDTVTGEIHDLKNSSYSFATTIGTFETRFVLRFTTVALGVPQFNADSVVVYNNDSGLHVTTGNVIMKNVRIYDVAGRLIASRNNIDASETLFTNLPTTQQVLLVQITADTGEKVTKKVVY